MYLAHAGVNAMTSAADFVDPIAVAPGGVIQSSPSGERLYVKVTLGDVPVIAAKCSEIAFDESIAMASEVATPDAAITVFGKILQPRTIIAGM
jgi:hypothetical protein